MAVAGISGRFFQRGNPDRLCTRASRSFTSHPVTETENGRIAPDGTGHRLAGLCLGDAEEQGSPAPPAKSKAPATSEKPKIPHLLEFP